MNRSHRYTVADDSDASSSSSSSSTSASTSSTTYNSPSGPSTRTLAIAIGAALGCLALILILAAFILIRRRRKYPKSFTDVSYTSMHPASSVGPTYLGSSTEPSLSRAQSGYIVEPFGGYPAGAAHPEHESVWASASYARHASVGTASSLAAGTAIGEKLSNPALGGGLVRMSYAGAGDHKVDNCHLLLSIKLTINFLLKRLSWNTTLIVLAANACTLALYLAPPGHQSVAPVKTSQA